MKDSLLDGVSVVVQDDPDKDHVNLLVDHLISFNDQYVPPENHSPLAAFAWRGAELVGGCNGITHWEWLFVSQLWVSADLRGCGLGARLLGDMEIAAQGRGATDAHLNTFDFQARGFYERHGYRQFAELSDYPGGHTMYFLVKHF